jgi:hypothetical protein
MDAPDNDNAKLIEAFVVALDDSRAKLIEALRVVRDRQASGADDWEYSLLRTFVKYLEAIGVDRELRAPLWKMYIAKRHELEQAKRREEGKPGTPMPLGKMNAMVVAAAAGTVLHQQGKGKIGDVLAFVARAAGIERKALKSFRDNINRGLSPRAAESYQQYVTAFKDRPPEEIKKFLPLLRGFVADPL